jgi:Protein of unknown function (DUF1569)
MPELHDPEVREAIKSRVRNLQSDGRRKWGAMTVDQMLWHVSGALELCLGRMDSGGESAPFPMPKSMLRFVVLNLPRPKGVPTLRAITATKRYDFQAEQARCLKLIDEFTAKPIRDRWPEHPVLGNLSGSQYSRLQAKHILHHLEQFGG